MISVEAKTDEPSTSASDEYPIYDIANAVRKVLNESETYKFFKETWIPSSDYSFTVNLEGNSQGNSDISGSTHLTGLRTAKKDANTVFYLDY